MNFPDNPKAVLFDMDGTVVDSEPLRCLELVELMRAHGAAMEDHEFDHLIGSDTATLLAAMQEVLDREGIEKDALSVLMSHLGRREDAYLDPRCAPFDGVESFLRDLRSRGILTALVSNTPTYALMCALNRFRLAGLFDAVIGGDMVERAKPDPQGYLLAMRLLGVEPSDCIVIEDTPSGIYSGLAAGAFVCARDNGAGILDLSAAHMRFSSYADLRLCERMA